MNYVQQGDVLLKSVEQFPKGTKVSSGNLIWKGQNHHHRLNGKFTIRKLGDQTFVESKGCTLFHEEHKDIKVAKGKYQLWIVMEYDHLLEESRQVID